jgi:hypothetical protein
MSSRHKYEPAGTKKELERTTKHGPDKSRAQSPQLDLRSVVGLIYHVSRMLFTRHCSFYCNGLTTFCTGIWFSKALHSDSKALTCRHPTRFERRQRPILLEVRSLAPSFPRAERHPKDSPVIALRIGPLPIQPNLCHSRFPSSLFTDLSTNLSWSFANVVRVVRSQVHPCLTWNQR